MHENRIEISVTISRQVSRNAVRRPRSRMTATARGTHRGANSNPTLEFWKVGNPSPCQFDWHRPSDIAASQIAEHNSYSSGDRQRQQRKAGVKARAWVLCSASASPFGLRSSRTEHPNLNVPRGGPKQTAEVGQAKLPKSSAHAFGLDRRYAASSRRSSSRCIRVGSSRSWITSAHTI